MFMHNGGNKMGVWGIWRREYSNWISQPCARWDAGLRIRTSAQGRQASRVPKGKTRGLWFAVLLLTTSACDAASKNAWTAQKTTAPAAAADPVPLARPVEAEEPREIAPEQQLLQGTLAEWRGADKETRFRAADRVNHVFERTQPPDHELTKRERAMRAVKLDRCVMQTAQEPSMQHQKVSEIAALCLIAGGTQ